MRLQGQAQLGYFPTPPSQLELIATWLRLEAAPPGVTTRLLDPCAGREKPWLVSHLGWG